MNRRGLLRHSLGLASAAFGATALMGQGVQAQNSSSTREIEMVAQRFKFSPNEIPLKVGERVILAIRSLDFIHGMHIPDLGIRVDLLPGQITRIELQPQRSGVVDFLCDNFCGGGHEDMQGRLLVSD